MARRRAKIFSQRELQVMKAVWDLGRASVKEIRSYMGGDDAGAYTSIATMLKFLESKGALRHEQIGRTYYYSPNTTKEEEQQKAILYLHDIFFDGDCIKMLEKLFENIQPSHDELMEIEELINNHKQTFNLQ